MLLIFNKFHDIDIPQLMEVCVQSNTTNGRRDYPTLDACEQLRMAEEDLCGYIRESLYSDLLCCAVWAPGGRYKAILRQERHNDGYLLTGLETAPQERRKGYAESLIRAVLTAFPSSRFYSHITLSNLASIRVHEKCGFYKILDYAVYLDGSISTAASTYLCVT